MPTHRSRISLENEGFVVHEFPIDKAWGEEKLRSEIKKAFPVLDQKNSNFSYVKACYGEIVVPKIADGVSMDATRVLSIAQQACIYLQPDKILQGESEEFEDDISDSEFEKCSWDVALEEKPNKQLCTESASAQSFVDLTKQRESIPSSSSKATREEQQMLLREMFPSRPEEDIDIAVASTLSIEEAAERLADEIPKKDLTIGDVLEELRKGMIVDERRKLKVDEEDLLEDALSYYKRPDFDPKYPIRVQYKGQPAADTGGVMKQFFTDLLSKLAEHFFSGTERKVPLYNTDILVSGLLKMTGKIIVHSILQGGPGFPVFSTAVFTYLATGSVDEAMQHLSIDECASPLYRDTALKVCSVVNDGISQLIT